MRNITNIRKLKKGELPVLKLIINGIDYSDNLIDCDKLFVDKRMEEAIGQPRLQDLTLYLYDPAGEIEGQLNSQNYEMELKLVVDTEEISLFKGITLCDQLERDGKKLVIKCVSYLKLLADKTLEDYFSDAANAPIAKGLHTILQDIFPDSETIETPLFDIVSSKGIVSILDASDYHSGGDLYGSLTSPFVYANPSVNTYDFAVINRASKRIEFYRIGIVNDEPVCNKLQSINPTWSFSWDEAKILGYKNNKLYFAVRQHNSPIYLAYVDTNTWTYTLIKQISSSTNVDGSPIGVDIELDTLSFNYYSESVIFATSDYDAENNQTTYTLYEVYSDSSIYRRLTNTNAYNIFLKHGWAFSTDTDCNYLVGSCLFDGYFVGAVTFTFDGTSWSFTTQPGTDVHVNSNITAFQDTDVYFLVSSGGTYHLLKISDGSLINLYIYARNEEFVTGWVDSSIDLSNQILLGNATDTNADSYSIVKITSAGNVDGISKEDFSLKLGFTPNYKIYPLTFKTDSHYSFFVGELHYADDESRQNRPVIGFISETKRIPWFVIHKDNLQVGAIPFLDQLALYGSYLISYESITKVTARLRVIGDSVSMTLTQDDYQQLPEMQYERIIKGVAVTPYYGEAESTYYVGDCSSSRYRLDLNCPFAWLTQSLFVAQWYIDNYGQPNGIFTLTTPNIVSIEEMDVISFTDHLGREQTGVVIGTQYEYPHKYTIIVHSKTVETEATEPDLPPPEPSPPEWQNVSISAVRLRPGSHSNVKVTVAFDDIGGLPVERLKVILQRITRDSNDDVILDREEFLNVDVQNRKIR